MPKAARVRERLRGFALGFPEAYEDHPWGETVVKVGKKIFVFLGGDDAPEHHALTVKLPDSADQALAVPGAAPTGYGLGRAGWVTIPLDAPTPFAVLTDWIDESYRAVAPKRLVAKITAG